MVNISPEFFGLFMFFTLIINANIYISQSRHTIKLFKHFIIIVIYSYFKIKKSEKSVYELMLELNSTIQLFSK